jgi:hypothetical protein
MKAALGGAGLALGQARGANVGIGRTLCKAKVKSRRGAEEEAEGRE